MSLSGRPGAVPELFAEQSCEQTLRRVWWLLWLSLASAAAVAWAAEGHPAGDGPRAIVGLDAALAVAGLVLVGWQRRRPGSWRVRQGLVLAVFAYTLVAMDAYYFVLLVEVGPVASYAVGAMCAALFFVLRPVVFSGGLLLNHAAFVVLVGLSALTDEAKLVAWIEGTFAVQVAMVAQGLMYASRKREWEQRRSLEAANVTLERRAGEMNELMAIAAHDLRSPLQALQLTLQEMADEPQAEERGRMRAAGRAAGDRMLHLIERLLEAHRVEQMPAGAPVAGGDLRELVQGAVERAAMLAAHKGVELRAALPAGPARARFYAAELAQAVDNLVSNALKFAPAGSVVEVGLVRVGAAWRIDVCDEGPGVAVEERAQLFSKFFRGSAPATGDEARSGLGLFIVRTLVERMGGVVGFAPREPQGARFSVTLRAEG